MSNRRKSLSYLVFVHKSYPSSSFSFLFFSFFSNQKNIAAQQEHREACFALTAWYLVGSPGVLPQSDTEAYLWALKAADAGLAKAQYAVGYFSEVSTTGLLYLHLV